AVQRLHLVQVVRRGLLLLAGGCGHVRHLRWRPGQGQGAPRLPLVHPHRRHQGRQELELGAQQRLCPGRGAC
ncbi:unnamed protein product, partial [Ectocarpus fasciculatus]